MFVFKFFGWNRENGPLGNGVTGLVQSRQFLKKTLQGRIGTFVGLLILFCNVKEKVRKLDCTREIKNYGTNPLVENIEIIQSQR